jgi:hypothetical protein
MTIKKTVQAAITTAKVVATIANPTPTPLDKQYAQWQQVRGQTPTSQHNKPTSSQSSKK